MMGFFTRAAGWLCVLPYLTSVQAIPTNHDAHLLSRQTVLPPSQDPFYTTPANADTAQPGDILTFRELDGNNFPDAPIAATYQLLYRTTTAVGDVASSVVTVLIPPNADFSKLFSYQSPYDRSFIDCSPSYAFTPGSNSAIASTIAGDVGGEISTALNRGYIVSVPDYEVNAAWTDGLGSGHGVLDSIIAVHASGVVGTGIDSAAKTVLYGYSGGSQATEWAVELHSTYGTGRHLVAAAMGGLPVNITTTNLALNGQPAAGYIPTSFVGLGKAYPEFQAALDADLKPETADFFRQPLSSCSIRQFAGQDIFSTYFKSGAGFIDLPGARDAIEKGAVMGQRGAPQGFPLYIFKGTADEIVPTIEDTDNLVARYCGGGSKINYVRYEGGTHGATREAGSADALAFLFGILDGGLGLESCSTRTVSA